MRSFFDRLLLAAYPPEFRDRYGDEVLAFWASQARERRYRGGLGRLRYALQRLHDAVTAGLRMRWRRSTGKEGMMKSLWTDLRYARRALAGAPLFTLVAVVTIALGIGATTAVFAVVDGVVLRPLPYPDADRLVRVLRTLDAEDTDHVAWPDFRDWREQADGFEGMTAYTEAEGALEWEGGAEVLTGSRVTRDFFDVMGVPLALGRTFSEAEDQLGGADAMILSHRLWVSRFQADPAVIGRTVPYSGSNVPIVGVAAEGFSAPYEDTRHWVPMQGDQLLADVGLPTGGRSLNFLSVIGRLAPGVDAVAAGEGVRTLARRIDEEVGKPEARWSAVALVPLDVSLVGDARGMLLFLLAAAALVLVVAGANVAGLALSRSAMRAPELAMRQALGAARGRLLRQLLTEGVLLCGVAGMVGLLLASLLLNTLMGLAPPGLPRAEQVGISTTTLLFALAATLGSGIVVGLLPAWHASRSGLSMGLLGGRGTSSGRGALRPQQVLASFQVAIAVVLLTGAALLTNSFTRLIGVDPGFEAESVLVATIAPSDTRYESPEELSAFYASLLDRVRMLPGVSHASTTYSPPLFDNGFRTTVIAEGAGDDTEDYWAGTVIIGDDYFETNGIPLLKGRDFEAGDRLGEPLVAIVSETMASRLWPGEDALGKRFEFSGGIRGSADSFDPAFFPDESMTVVGVAGDVRRASLAEEPEPEYYRPHAQLTWGFQYLMVRSLDDGVDLAPLLRETVWAIDPTVPVREITTLQSQLSESVATYRFRMLILLVFAGLASLLAMVGLYAIMALAVTRRVREMGIRMALGARRQEVMRGILGRGLRLVAWGTVIGLAAAWAGSEALTSMLFQVEPTDPATYALVVLVTTCVGLLACYLPARRAGRVDPAVTLQQE